MAGYILQYLILRIAGPNVEQYLKSDTFSHHHISIQLLIYFKNVFLMKNNKAQLHNIKPQYIIYIKIYLKIHISLIHQYIKHHLQNNIYNNMFLKHNYIYYKQISALITWFSSVSNILLMLVHILTPSILPSITIQ